MEKYYITNETAVDYETLETIKTNNEMGDAKCTLCYANELGGATGSRIVFMTTNADPVYVGAVVDGVWVDTTTEQDVINAIDLEFDIAIDEIPAIIAGED